MRLVNWLCLTALMFGTSCISRYNPVLDNDQVNKYVVSGKVTNSEGWQEVAITRSAPVDEPEYIPVTGCNVNIQDDAGTIYHLSEYSTGKYRVWMEPGQVIPGRSYRVDILTQDGTHLQSDYDSFVEGPEIDSLSYFVEPLPNTLEGGDRRCLKFYIDLDANGYMSNYYRWEITETWEYRAARPIEYYYNRLWYQVYPPDESWRTCWRTRPLHETFTLSTNHLQNNAFLKFPLHYVDGFSTSRLGILYSILVSQQSLSRAAYEYWDKLRMNSSEQGGLYDEQPIALKGNIHNLTDPTQEALGYYYAAWESKRRYFFHDVEGIQLEFDDHCVEFPLPIKGWASFIKESYPIYYYYNEQGQIRILNNDCVDCRMQGGKTEKPDFWP